MKPTLAATSFVLAAAIATPAPALEGFWNLLDGRNDLSSQMGPASNMKRKRADARMAVPSGHQGQWYTAPNGCSYSRAGGGWFLILNPHHIGQPNAHTGCAPRL